MDEESIYWIEPIIVDGVARYPLCESECTSEQSRQYRQSHGEDNDCRLSAKVSWRGRNLCKRHAAKLALNEMVKTGALPAQQQTQEILMGREVRRVPKDWQHPKKKTFDYRTGRETESYQPMYDRPFAPAMDEWYREWKAWEDGTHPDREGHDYPYWEWNGGPPDPLYYRPEWPEESRTHLMMYESTSEGTPISPAFETPEELARWLADTGAISFGGMTATYEQWLTTCRGAWAPSMVMQNGIMKSGVEFSAESGQTVGAESADG